MTLGGGESRPSFGSGRRRSEYAECSFDGSRIRSPLGWARFERCSFREVELIDWGNCTEFEFIECVFTGLADDITFYGKRERMGGLAAALVGRRLGFTRNEFRGNDFSGMELRGVDFRMGIDLGQQTLPRSDDYVVVPDARRALERAREQVERWEDPAERDQALGELGLPLLRQYVEDGQEQLFFRISETQTRPPGFARLYALLAEIGTDSVGKL
jgi:hypothetical protein